MKSNKQKSLSFLQKLFDKLPDSPLIALIFYSIGSIALLFPMALFMGFIDRATGSSRSVWSYLCTLYFCFVVPLWAGIPVLMFGPKNRVKMGLIGFTGYGAVFIYEITSLDFTFLWYLFVVLCTYCYYNAEDKKRAEEALQAASEEAAALKRELARIDEMAIELYGDRADPITGMPITTARSYFTAVMRLNELKK